MSRSSLFLAVSAFALVACQPAAEAPVDLSAETPPVVEQAAVSDAVEVAEQAEEAAETVIEAEAAEEDHDHEGEDHDHGDEHEHSDEEHAHAEDEHDHDDHDHTDDGGHDDHDHAGGEVHVHGLSELAASIEGSTLSVNLEGALANFGLDETLRTLDDSTPYTDGVVAIIGGDCTRTSAEASIRPVNDHGNMVLDWRFECAAATDIEAIDVTGFANFDGFEQVDAVFLTDAGQTAESLTASDTRLDLN